jgi:hypothetical protein
LSQYTADAADVADAKFNRRYPGRAYVQHLMLSTSWPFLPGPGGNIRAPVQAGYRQSRVDIASRACLLVIVELDFKSDFASEHGSGRRLLSLMFACSALTSAATVVPGLA